MISDVIKIGDKVDICAVTEIEREKEDGEKPRILMSQILDIDENGVLSLLMPTEHGKLVLLSLGVRYELVFYAKGGLYRGMGQVTDRYKEDNFFIAKLTLKSGISKYQRREFFRMQCILGMQYYLVDKELAVIQDVGQLEQIVSTAEMKKEEKKAVIVDISGGGIRFVGSEPIPDNSYLIVIMQLSGENINKIFVLGGHLISCTKANNFVDRYENRMEFILHNQKIREEIIRYIFDEDRKVRKKEKVV